MGDAMQSEAEVESWRACERWAESHDGYGWFGRGPDGLWQLPRLSWWERLYWWFRGKLRAR